MTRMIEKIFNDEGELVSPEPEQGQSLHRATRRKVTPPPFDPEWPTQPRFDNDN